MWRRGRAGSLKGALSQHSHPIKRLHNASERDNSATYDITTSARVGLGSVRNSSVEARFWRGADGRDRPDAVDLRPFRATASDSSRTFNTSAFGDLAMITGERPGFDVNRECLT